MYAVNDDISFRAEDTRISRPPRRFDSDHKDWVVNATPEGTDESEKPFNVTPDPRDASRGGGSRESILDLNVKRGRDSSQGLDHRIDDHVLVHSSPIPTILDPRIPRCTDPSAWSQVSLTTRLVKMGESLETGTRESQWPRSLAQRKT